MTRETRFRYELIEQPPEGWRFVRNEFNDSERYALWTSAPVGAANPLEYDYRWFELRQVEQERVVTEWQDVGPTCGQPAPEDTESLDRLVHRTPDQQPGSGSTDGATDNSGSVELVREHAVLDGSGDRIGWLPEDSARRALDRRRSHHAEHGPYALIERTWRHADRIVDDEPGVVRNGDGEPVCTCTQAKRCGVHQ